MNASSASVSACADLRLSAKAMPTTEKRRSTVARRARWNAKELASHASKVWEELAAVFGPPLKTGQSQSCIGSYHNTGDMRMGALLTRFLGTSSIY